jgi:hypothetical protein
MLAGILGILVSTAGRSELFENIDSPQDLMTADDLHIRIALQHAPEALTQYRMIINEQHPHPI